jgi:transposase
VLRREGLYQSQLREWAVAAGAPRPAGYRGRSRRAATSPAAAVVGDHDRALRAERDRLAKQLTQTEAALEIMGKLHVLLESISESTGTPPVPRTP